MKRLKFFLSSMDNDTTTYKEMYEGRMVIPPGTFGNPGGFSIADNDAEYWWNDEIAFEIQQTHKNAKDKPTVICKIPAEMLGAESFSPAEADCCLREFKPFINALNSELHNGSRPANEQGKYYLYSPGGEVLVRNAAYFRLHHQKGYENGSGCTVYIQQSDVPKQPRMCLFIMLQVQLPKRKLRRAIQMLCHDLPGAVESFLFRFDHRKLEAANALAAKQKAIREFLRGGEYCAFIANGSILPRQKNTGLPLPDAVPFVSPPGDETEICGVRGMGVKRGVTVITGGGYSGKSTMLDAISAGIYDHVGGDGRELCITDDTAFTVSAEDGRSVKHVNISPFIKWLPGGDTADFSTDRASGSTSQAANIMEAVEFGARLLLIDEDRSATNFMIRDEKMKALIEREPITPFTDRVRELCTEAGVSTILVIGGSGEYLSVADKVYMMDEFVISDVTEKAYSLSGGRRPPDCAPAVWTQSRSLRREGFTSYPSGSGTEKLEVSDMGLIFIGDEKIDLRGLHDIVTPRQLDTLGYMLRKIAVGEYCGLNGCGVLDVKAAAESLYSGISREGLDSVFSSWFTTTERFLDLPRIQELYAVIARMRKVNFTS